MNFLDPSSGVFVNINGTTGEMITDPNTGELKIVSGSSAPIGGGAGGPTQYSASGGPSPALGTNTLAGLLSNPPSWTLPAIVFIVILWFASSIFRSR